MHFEIKSMHLQQDFQFVFNEAKCALKQLFSNANNSLVSLL